MKPRVKCDTCGEVREGTDGENAFDFRARLRRDGWRCALDPRGVEQSLGAGTDECASCTAHRKGARS